MNASTVRLYAFSMIAGILFFALVGCAGRPSIFPNSDPALRKTSTQFAADAAKRFPYKADVARGGDMAGRADKNYMLDNLRLVNLSDTTWVNVEVWINQTYVLFIPNVEPQKLRTLPFQMFYNVDGQSFPTDNSKWLINSVEVYVDGKMYNLKAVNGD